MNDGRVIYYSDARHYHMYVYDPPMALEETYAPVEEAEILIPQDSDR